MELLCQLFQTLKRLDKTRMDTCFLSVSGKIFCKQVANNSRYPKNIISLIDIFLFLLRTFTGTSQLFSISQLTYIVLRMMYIRRIGPKRHMGQSGPQREGPYGRTSGPSLQKGRQPDRYSTGHFAQKIRTLFLQSHQLSSTTVLFLHQTRDLDSDARFSLFGARHDRRKSGLLVVWKGETLQRDAASERGVQILLKSRLKMLDVCPYYFIDFPPVWRSGPMGEPRYARYSATPTAW